MSEPTDGNPTLIHEPSALADGAMPAGVGRYRVLRTLGSGGMGVVYLAEDPILKRPVAIKVVHWVATEREQALARFRREAEVSARLNHPYVGELPFSGDSLSKLLYRIAHEPPALSPRLDPALRKVLERALDKEPAARFAGVEAFVRALVEATHLPFAARARLRNALEGDIVEGILAARGIGGGPTPAEQPGASPFAGIGLALRHRPVVGGLAALVLGVLLVRWATAPSNRTLTVGSVPQGAAVLVDGTRVGTTPLRGLVVPASAERITLTKRGYQEEELPLEALEGPLRVLLKRTAPSIDVRSVPAGATVFLDGSRVGTTPIESLAVAGSLPHELKLELTGYETLTHSFARLEEVPQLFDLVAEGSAAGVAADRARRADDGFWRSVGDGFRGLGEQVVDGIERLGDKGRGRGRR